MSKEIPFIKMQATGNDFIVMDDRSGSLEGTNLTSLSIEMCDRHFGVGADGLIIVSPSNKADLRMRIFNPDGSEPEMCGNGIRCFAKYVYDTSKEKKDVISVETLAGIMVPAIIVKNGEAVGSEVDMGEPKLKASEIPMTKIQNPNKEVIDHSLEVDGKTYRITAVSMGNPHCVVFVDDLKKIDLADLGPKIENHPQFPKRTNVEFVQVLSDKEISFKVWERGAGETLACGTGACAAVVASVLNKKTSRRVLVHLPGGELDVEWLSQDNHLALRGPAEKVFEGKYIVR